MARSLPIGWQRNGVSAGVPVVCIGNPTVGGAGKTPAALTVARMLAADGETPVFLTRGYGGRLAGPVRVDPLQHRAADVGDEPLLLARAHATVVARDRVARARRRRWRRAPSVIVMDDGFQNPSLAKDFSVLVVDGRRGIGNGRTIPAGPLRAPLGAQLDRAQALIVVGEGAAASVMDEARKRALPVFGARLAPDAAFIASLAGKRVLAFAGIGDPEKFFATLRAQRRHGRRGARLRRPPSLYARRCPGVVRRSRARRSHSRHDGEGPRAHAGRRRCRRNWPRGRARCR